MKPFIPLNRLKAASQDSIKGLKLRGYQQVLHLGIASLSEIKLVQDV
jgi:hypothetical protein